MAKNKLYSVNLERACLAGCLKFPDKVTDVLPFIESKDFYISGNAVIFSAISQFIDEDKSIDPILISERLVNLGINQVQGVDVGDYVLAISKVSNISESSFEDQFKELKKYSICRDLVEMGGDIEKLVIENKS